MSGRLSNGWDRSPSHGLLTAFAAITLIACGGDREPTAPLTTPVAPAVGVSISPLGLNLIVGGEGRLTARAYDAKDQTITASFQWSSANPDIATVGESDGLVTAISPGNTTMTATVGALRATATVSVRPANPAGAVTISPSALSLVAGMAERLTARAFDSTGRATTASFEWSSADSAIASVAKSDGMVTAISAGTTTVTVAVGSLRATATVSVIALAGSFAFTRLTVFSTVRFTSDVLTFSVADRTVRSLPRPSQFTSIASPAWSPDGTRLAVEVIHAFSHGDELSYDYESDVYVLDAAAPAASPWRPLTANRLSTLPSWSPDGKRIAYVQEAALWSDNNDIYIIDAAGGTPVRLTQAKGWYSKASWSPDGTRLTFSAFLPDGGEDSHIFIVNADGSGLTRITRGSGSDFEPTWSPDGARLAFVSSRDYVPGAYHYDVFVVDIDGSNVRRLTSSGAYNRGPVWSPDGGQISFSSGSQLHVMNADGSALTRITTPPPYTWDSAPAWRR